MFILEWLLLPFVFYTLFVISVLSLIWWTENESFWGSLFATIGIVGLGFLKYGSFTQLYEAVKAYPEQVILLIASYFAAGACWSIFKWFLFCSDAAKKLNRVIKDTSKERAAEVYDRTTLHTKQQILDSNFAILAPVVSDNKSKITSWIVLWVPSVVWFLINDPIRRLGNWIYDRLGKVYQSIATAAFKID